MSLFFNPFSKKERESLQTPKGKQGLKMVIIFVVVVAIVIIIGALIS